MCIRDSSLLMAKMFQELQKHGQVKFDLVFLAMDPGYHKNIRPVSYTHLDVYKRQNWICIFSICITSK